MPRIARRDLKTCFFHIIVQGINKEYIFRKREYIEKYLFLIKKYFNLHNVRIISYCIMNNHAHFLIYTENTDNMSKAMQKVNTIYAKYYNEKEDRVGYLFRNRYASQPILTEAQLMRCIVYIHRNPVVAKIVADISGYKYSSYKDYINKNGIINNEILQLVFGATKNYIDIFLEVHKIQDINEIMDIIETPKKYEEIIKEYSRIVPINKLSYKDDVFKDLVISLNTEAGLSIREIAKRLGKNKDLLSRMLRE